MSKKDKSKFRKQIKAQIMQEMAKVQTETNSSKPQVNQQKKETEISPAFQSTTVAATSSDINLPQIKYDLKKTGIVVGSIAIMITGLYFLDLKYGILMSFGNWLFGTLNIK